MKLKAHQISYIKQYLSRYDLKYYEVFEEVLDQLTTQTESILQNQPELSFEVALDHAKEECFGKNGFQNIIKSKDNSISNLIRKESNAALKSILTSKTLNWGILGCIAYYFFISLFENPEKIHMSLLLLLLAIGIIYVVPILKYRKKDGLFVMKIDKLFLELYLTTIPLKLSLMMILLGRDILNFNHVFVKIIFSVLLLFNMLMFMIFIQTKKQILNKAQIY